MVSLVKKIKKMYKGSYYYANKKYGKYTKRRPFPNFNDFDCSPSGDFSMNEVPAEMDPTRKVDFQKKNSYINTSNDYSLSVVTEGNNVYMTSTSPATGDILGLENDQGYYAPTNSVSPVTSLSDSNTDFTMVNSNTNDYYNNNGNNHYTNNTNDTPVNPFQSPLDHSRDSIQNDMNPFYERSDSSVCDSSYTTTFDGMHEHRDYYAKEMKRISRMSGFNNGNHANSNENHSSDEDIKVNYQGKNNWKVEMKRYYPSMPQTDEPTDYRQEQPPMTMEPESFGMDMKKKKWWKKMIPTSKKHKHATYQDSTISENTYYDRDQEEEYNPKRYDSARHSTYYTCYNGDYDNGSYNSHGNYGRHSTYGTNNDSDNLTDGVLVVNENANNSILY